MNSEYTSNFECLFCVFGFENVLQSFALFDAGEHEQHRISLRSESKMSKLFLVKKICRATSIFGICEQKLNVKMVKHFINKLICNSKVYNTAEWQS